MFFNWRRQNDVFIKKGVFILAFLFLCVSCATTRTLFFDGSGAGEVRKDIGRIEGVELSIKNSSLFIEGYSENLERGIEREGDLIEELKRLLCIIRERGNLSAEETD